MRTSKCYRCANLATQWHFYPTFKGNRPWKKSCFHIKAPQITEFRENSKKKQATSTNCWPPFHDSVNWVLHMESMEYFHVESMEYFHMERANVRSRKIWKIIVFPRIFDRYPSDGIWVCIISSDASGFRFRDIYTSHIRQNSETKLIN